MSKMKYTAYDCKCDSCEVLLSINAGEMFSERELKFNMKCFGWKEYKDGTTICNRCGYDRSELIEE